MKANLVLRNTSVYTVDKDRSWAQAVAIADGKIVFVGTDADVQLYIGPDTDVMDLDGKMVLPGLVDAHAHPGRTCRDLQAQRRPDHRGRLGRQ